MRPSILFREVFISINIVNEAARCLQCKNARCVAACPVRTPIPQILSYLLDGDINEAGKALFENNPLSLICSIICPHEKFCEGNCVLGVKNTPVSIGDIEKYISEFYLDKYKQDTVFRRNQAQRHDKKIAIIGSGPAGIACSIILALRGYDVTLFEAKDRIGGILQFGIPEYRLPKHHIKRIKSMLYKLDIKIRFNSLVGPVITIDHLFRDEYQAVIIATGAWRSKALGIKGESLGHVHYSMNYLQNPDVFKIGKRLCVIGAGNVAMDVARTALRKGVESVTVLYHKGEKQMSATKSDYELTKIDGASFEFYKSPVEITDKGVKFLKTTYDEETKKLTRLEGTEGLLLADNVIIASGLAPRDNITAYSEGIEFHSNRCIKTNEFGETSRKGVFATGDVTSGSRTVVEAVASSKITADRVDYYLRSLA